MTITRTPDRGTKRLRRQLVAGTTAGLLAFAGPADACVGGVGRVAAPVTGCEASTRYAPGSRSCSYLALTGGDIAARGSWLVSIHRGQTDTTHSGDDATTVTVLHGAIQPGDSVYLVARDPGGAVITGPLAANDRPSY
jgi:hypothetical protein